MAGRPLNRQPSTSSQQPSTDRRSSIRFSNPDIFSDDFALEPFEVADGYNPASASGTPEQPTSQPCTTPQRSSSGNATAEQSVDLSRPSKSSQNHDSGGSFTLRHEAQPPQNLQRGGSVTSVSEASDLTSFPHRSLSTSTTSAIPRIQSPYQGATGPSHPYGMYPQDIGMTRNPSVATNSTINMPERTYARNNGPTHPYGMYSQTTVPEGDVGPTVGMDPSIPVGFPGHGRSYRRRLGPEGEEAADIIGPDGHTEQLPPYTRYPDGIPPKPAPRGPTNTFDITPNPEVSQDTINSAPSPLSATHSNVTEVNGTRLNVAAVAGANRLDDTGSFKERWTEKGKKRMCKGKFPVWIVIVIVFLLVLAGALLGGIIGRVIGRRRGEQNAEQAEAQALQTAALPTITVTTTSLIDATPMPTPPTNLPSLPSGTFVVPLGRPTEASRDCLSSASQTNAWSCGSGGLMGMAISPSDGGNRIQLLDGLSSGRGLRYGAQPPVLNDPYNLVIMLDRADLNRGPAHFFQQNYDKLVIVPERKIRPGSSKRSIEDVSGLEERGAPGGWYHGETAQPGDRPWYCFWNNTLLEGFIYVTQNSSAACLNASSTSTTSPIPVNTAPQSLAPLNGVHKREFAKPPFYPKVVKIEERRHTENAVGPYCQQMQVLYDGSLGLATNSSGDVIIVQLEETKRNQQTSTKSSKKRREWEQVDAAGVEKRQEGSGSCHCVWVAD